MRSIPDQYTPPLFQMHPPFADMNNKRIRITNENGDCHGKIILYVRPAEDLIGIRLDILQALVPCVDRSRADDFFKTAGTCAITQLGLSKQQIESIKVDTSAECDFWIEM